MFINYYSWDQLKLIYIFMTIKTNKKLNTFIEVFYTLSFVLLLSFHTNHYRTNTYFDKKNIFAFIQFTRRMKYIYIWTHTHTLLIWSSFSLEFKLFSTACTYKEVPYITLLYMILKRFKHNMLFVLLWLLQNHVQTNGKFIMW